jgi:hypothetical protein
VLNGWPCAAIALAECMLLSIDGAAFSRAVGLSAPGSQQADPECADESSLGNSSTPDFSTSDIRRSVGIEISRNKRHVTPVTRRKFTTICIGCAGLSAIAFAFAVAAAKTDVAR